MMRTVAGAIHFRRVPREREEIWVRLRRLPDGCLDWIQPDTGKKSGEELWADNAGGLSITQRPQYPFIKEYTLNYNRIPYMI